MVHRIWVGDLLLLGVSRCILPFSGIVRAFFSRDLMLGLVGPKGWFVR